MLFCSDCFECPCRLFIEEDVIYNAAKEFSRAYDGASYIFPCGAYYAPHPYGSLLEVFKGEDCMKDKMPKSKY